MNQSRRPSRQGSEPKDPVSPRPDGGGQSADEATASLNLDDLQGALDVLDQGIGVFDRGLSLVLFNNKFVECLELPPELAKAGSLFEAVARFIAGRGEGHSGGGEAEIRRRVDGVRKSTPHILEHTRADGTAIEIRDLPLPGGGLVTTCTDITYRKEVDEALRESEANLKNQIDEFMDREQRLEAQGMELVALARDAALIRDELGTLNRQKDKFFSIIAHDLRSPFNALLGFSSILESRGAELSADQVTDYGRLVHQAAQQSFALLEDLLDWSRLQMGRMDFDPQPLDIGNTLEAGLFLFEPNAAAKDIKLSADHPPGLMAFADAQMVQTILRNLINNAIKFTPEKGAIAVTAGRSGDWIEVAVTDNGIGMTAEKIERLFQLDEKTSTLGTGGESGTGLGLHLCKELVEKNGGEITIESTVGEGSAFKFTLPVAE